MAKGYALTIGLNSVSPSHYDGWSGELLACEADAKDMAEIAKSRGFSVKTLLTRSATRKNVIKELSKADRNKDEDDYQDETWCLYDGELIDDEIYKLLGRFASGVRILVFSDSCHSGTVTKAAFYQGTIATRSSAVSSEPVRYRFMPPEIALRTYRKNKKFYDSLQKDPALKKAEDSVKASVLLISGCQDNQYSSDGTFNGLFTGTLLQVWNDGKSSTYRKFYKAIAKRMPPEQTPNYYWVGTPSKKFEKQKPFTI